MQQEDLGMTSQGQVVTEEKLAELTKGANLSADETKALRAGFGLDAFPADPMKAALQKRTFHLAVRKLRPTEK